MNKGSKLYVSKEEFLRAKKKEDGLYVVTILIMYFVGVTAIVSTCFSNVF